MYIIFYGAVRQVTGSMHTLLTNHDVILFDCGLFQGRRKESRERNRVIPFDPNLVSNILLSHAHIDHCGRIPLFTRDEFNGRIVCTRATAAASQHLLRDSAYIQESDAQYLNYKTVRNFLYKTHSSSGNKKISHKEARRIKKRLKLDRYRLKTEEINRLLEEYNLKTIEPLYTIRDAEESMEYFRGYPYNHPVQVGKNAVCTFYDAGHILGSAMVHVKVRENGKQHTVLFTGDIGRFDKPIIQDPTLEFAEEDRNIDLLIMESTYGNRLHEPVRDLKPLLRKVLLETTERGGSIMIPAFAYGRTQEIIYFLHELYMEGEVPKIPIYVDSPLANKLTKVFGEHPETYDEDTHETFLENNRNPFLFKEINFVGSVEESMKLNREENPHIVIAGSGMCEGGRILHHLRHKVHDEKNTVLIVGYMAENTLGRKILELGKQYEESGRSGKAPRIKFFDSEYLLKAHVVRLGGFSAHGDKNEMTRFLKESNLNIKRIAVVHGEEEQSLSFARYLQKINYDAFVPKLGEVIRVE
jgi:metallo-beta-lactamase family protein